jgi:hypothetical protein
MVPAPRVEPGPTDCKSTEQNTKQSRISDACGAFIMQTVIDELSILVHVQSTPRGQALQCDFFYLFIQADFLVAGVLVLFGFR